MAAIARQIDSFPAAPDPRAPAAQYRQYTIGFSGPDAGDRRELERFIYNSFRLAYGARVRHFMPLLASLRNDRGDLLAACGFRCAGAGKMFIETYLDRPVEEVLSTRCGRSVSREDIIEVGSFAAFRPGMSRHMIAVLASHVRETGAEWAVFTATQGMRNAWGRLGIRLLPLCEASKERLDPASRQEWGSYYDTCPYVMAGNVPQGYSTLLDNLKQVEVLP